jgi:hypothetical protein
MLAAVPAAAETRSPPISRRWCMNMPGNNYPSQAPHIRRLMPVTKSRTAGFHTDKTLGQLGGRAGIRTTSALISNRAVRKRHLVMKSPCHFGIGGCLFPADPALSAPRAAGATLNIIPSACSKAVLPEVFGRMTAVRSPAIYTAVGLEPKLRNPESDCFDLHLAPPPTRFSLLQGQSDQTDDSSTAPAQACECSRTRVVPDIRQKGLPTPLGVGRRPPNARCRIRRLALDRLQGAYTALSPSQCKQKRSRIPSLITLFPLGKLERAKGFEPSTPTLAGLRHNF